MGLKQQDQSTVQRGANGEVLAMGAVKLYLAQPDPNSWTDSGIVGGAAVVSSRGQHFIRIVDFQSQAVVFEQEFYAGMEYNSSAGFFHMLELSDCVGGFCFADDGEADKFASAVQSVCSPSRSPPPAQPSRPAPPEPVRDHSPTVHVTTSSPSPPPTASTLTSSQRGSATNVSSPAPKEKKKAGFSLSKGFNSLKQKFKGDSGPDPANFSISGPSGFRHDSHIGWDPENGFEIRNIPPAWRQLFQDAGVKKKDLKDANTAKFIMETVAAACGGDPSSLGAPSGGHSGGGGGGGGGGGPAPPPPPGPPPPPAPGPPPPPSAHGGPASGPAGGGGGGGGRGGLLAQIQAGTQLKTVEDSGGLPDLNNMDEQGRNNLTNTLANALALRRADMVASDGDDDGDEGWDEWDG